MLRARECRCLLRHQIHFGSPNINSRLDLLICSSGSIGSYGFKYDLLKKLAEYFANHIDDSFVIIFFVIDDHN